MLWRRVQLVFPCVSGPWPHFAHFINRAFVSRFRNPLCQPFAGSAIMGRNITAEMADTQDRLQRMIAVESLGIAPLGKISVETADCAAVTATCGR